MADDESTLSRRTLVAAAGAAALTTGVAVQQIAQAAPAPAPANRPIRTGEPNPFYDYSPMPKRPKLTWPNGARVAVHLVSNIEHWNVHDLNGRMDVRNLPRNDYGLRVAGGPRRRHDRLIERDHDFGELPVRLSRGFEVPGSRSLGDSPELVHEDADVPMTPVGLDERRELRREIGVRRRGGTGRRGRVWGRGRHRSKVPRA